MYFTSLKLLFILSAASIISGASVAERDYTPAHASDRYGLRNDWSDDYRQQGSNENDYRDDKDYRRNNSFDDDLEFNEHRRNDNQHDRPHDRYRDDSDHTADDWDYSDYDNEWRRYRDDNNDRGVRHGEEDGSDNFGKGEDQQNEEPEAGSPAGGDSGIPKNQEKTNLPSSGNSGSTSQAIEPQKPSNQPVGDGIDTAELGRCRGNLVDGKVDILRIDADVCIGPRLGDGLANQTPGTLPQGRSIKPANKEASDVLRTVSGNLIGENTNDLDRKSNKDVLDDASKTPQTSGNPTADQDNLSNDTSNIPGVPGTPGDRFNQGQELSGPESGRCDDIAVRVRKLLGIDADAVVCLGNLIKIDPKHHNRKNINGLLSGVLGQGSSDRDAERRQREYCEMIEAHVTTLGIVVDAVVCLPEILIRL